VENHTAKRTAISTEQSYNNPEHAETTALVDELLSYTRDLMDSPDAKRNSAMRHIVAYSGGVDSSLVLALLEHAKIAETETVYGVLGRSPAVPQDQVQLARQVAEAIGAPLVEVVTTEGGDETYIANEGQACLACKTHLYSALEAVAGHASDEQQHSRHTSAAASSDHTLPAFQLYNGTNADDVQDTTRVGLIAAQNFHVQSPLRYTTKENVRRAAHHLALPNWNVAASPCLRSRLALGVEATQEHLNRIERAEQFVRQELQDVLREASNVRVRLLAGNRARLEIDSELLTEVESRTRTSRDLEHYFVETLGFESMSTKAFRSGSVAIDSSSSSRHSSAVDGQSAATTMERLRAAVA
jgi:PP-loop superfamily ATP-utilizing enzyme